MYRLILTNSHLPFTPFSLELAALQYNAAPIHRRFIYKDHENTHAQGTDPRVALGA